MAYTDLLDPTAHYRQRQTIIADSTSPAWFNNLRCLYPDLPRPRDWAKAETRVCSALYRAIADMKRLRSIRRVGHFIGWPYRKDRTPAGMVMQLAALRWLSPTKRKRRSTKAILIAALRVC